MNLLSLKAVVRDPKSGKLFSPSKTSFAWGKGIIASQCSGKCPPFTIGDDCRCGIYSSPNLQALDEYHTFENSLVVLLHTYGEAEIWTAPSDIWDAYVVRSWGASIVGVLMSGEDHFTAKSRYMLECLMLISQEFEVEIFIWKVIKEIITLNWKEKLGFDPYKADLNDPWRSDTWTPEQFEKWRKNV